MKHVYLVSFDSNKVGNSSAFKTFLAGGAHVALDDFDNTIPIAVDRLEPTEDHVVRLLPPEEDEIATPIPPGTGSLPS